MKDRRQKTEAVCIVCGNSFLARIRDLKKGWAKCCSRRCASQIRPHAICVTPPATQQEKVRANGLVNMRQRRTGLEVAKICGECHEVKKLDKHHDDYSKPNEVTYLCRSCHMKRHWKINSISFNSLTSINPDCHPIK